MTINDNSRPISPKDWKGTWPKPINLSYSHSGNLGDIIWGLPIITHFGAGGLNLIPGNIPTVIRKYNNGPVFPEYENRLSQKDFDMIAPLLEAQPYITKLTFEKDKTLDYDLDLFRSTVGSAFKTNFIETFFQTFNIPYDPATAFTPWLTATPKEVAKVVVTRTSRFHSGKTTTIPTWINLLRSHRISQEGVFIGLPEEHEAFQKLFCIQVPYYKINNFLEMAEVIAGAETYIGNQTFAYSLAIGLGKKTILELRSVDCHIQREGCYYF